MTFPSSCSLHLAGVSLLGSAPVENAYLILELPKPWPKKIKAEAALAEFKPLLKGCQEEVKLLATPRIDWLPLCQRPWALLVRWKQGRGFVQELPAKPDEIKAALAAPAEGQAYPLYLVCTHGTRDRCCGTLGFPVYRELLGSSRRKVLQVSHLGGHRYAPVVMALPEWRFFGHLDSATCLHLDEHLEAGRPYLAGYRGHGRLPKEVQPIEAELWSRYGEHLVGIRSAAATGREQWTVTARFRDGSERGFRAQLGSQKQTGYKSCEDIPSGKMKTFELPTLVSLQPIPAE